MDLDGHAIERRDFPISRRGYEPAAVDAHLTAIAAALSELQDRNAGDRTLGSSAAGQVQSVLDAAEQAAAGIVGDAELSARRAREEAERDASRTRADAMARAEHLIATVQGATEELQRRLEAMDGQVRELAAGLIAGAAALSDELSQAQRGLGALLDAHAPGAPAPGAPAGDGPAADVPAGDVPAGDVPAGDVPAGDVPAVHASAVADAESGLPGPHADGAGAVDAGGGADALGGEVAAAQADIGGGAGVRPAEEDRLAEEAEGERASDGPARSADLDGARLVALNMALNGESRERTGHYLAESFEIPDAEKLLDEVYAAIDG